MATNKFYSKLDVINLVNKLHEIDKLKNIFLNED